MWDVRAFVRTVLGALSKQGREWLAFFDPKGQRGAIKGAILWRDWAIALVLGRILMATGVRRPRSPSPKFTSQPQRVSPPRLPPSGLAVQPHSSARLASSNTALAPRGYTHFPDRSHNSPASMKREGRGQRMPGHHTIGVAMQGRRLLVADIYRPFQKSFINCRTSCCWLRGGPSGELYCIDY